MPRSLSPEYAEYAEGLSRAITKTVLLTEAAANGEGGAASCGALTAEEVFTLIVIGPTAMLTRGAKSVRLGAMDWSLLIG